MKISFVASLLFALFAVSVCPALAAEPDRATVLWPKLFAAEPIDTSLFAKSFFDEVPVSALKSVIGDLKKYLGGFVSSSGPATDAVLMFSDGSVRAQLSLDDRGKIKTLLFTTMAAPAATKVLLDLLTSGVARDDAFAPGVPKNFGSQVTDVLRQLRSQYGDFVKLEPLQGLYRVVCTRGSLVAGIALDGSGKIALIKFVPDAPAKASTRDDALQRLAHLPGKVSYVVLEGRTERAALNADTPMSIGSAFKLSVLAALQREITAGKRRWSDVVTLREGDKSLPSGRLQDWPSGMHLTLETLAAFMISISDNTATDALIYALGRQAIEPFAFGNVPLLTTRNLFALKSKGAAGLREQWRRGSLAQRRALLAKLDALPIPAIAQADIQPADLDIEWHYSVRQLCELMAHVAALPLMSINPSVALRSDWKSVAYKGGSDAGVVHMTTMLKTSRGTNYCVSATVNNADAAVDFSTFSGPYSSVLDQLKGAGAGNTGAGE